MSTPQSDTGRPSSLTIALYWCLLIALISHGGIGITSARASTAVPPAPPSEDRITTMAVADGTTCIVTDHGQTKCWGLGDMGQLGRGDTLTVGDDESPSSAGFIEVGGFAVDIKTNGRQAFALLDTGAVRAWGANDAFELGLRHTKQIGDDETPANASVAVDVELGGLATRLAVGDDFACALLDDGQVQCWGANSWGQLGYGHTQRIGDDESPADAGTVALSGSAVDVIAGAHHACALLEGGLLQCWGRGDDGQLGYGDTDDVGDDEVPADRGPVVLDDTVVEVTAGEAHTCVRVQSGNVRCWGLGDAGRLGAGNTESIGDDELPGSVPPVGLGGSAVALAAGARHTCAILEGGRLRCWGEGLDGRLGYGNEHDIGDDELPAEVGDVDLGEHAASSIFAGPTASSTCVQRDDGAIRCWGLGDVGQLGYGDTASRGDSASTTPMRIPDLIVIDDAEE